MFPASWLHGRHIFLPCPEVLAVKIRHWHFQWDASCIQLVSTLWVVMLLIAKQYCLGFWMLPIAAMMAKQYCLGFRMLPIAALMAKQYCLGFRMLPTTVPMAK
jgi:hypothetical protein